MGIIYGYRKIDENKIVYVGQTIDLISRNREHIKYEPYNKTRQHYNYPLSKAIRKYGEDAFELKIIEDQVPIDQLNEREKYWIKYYDTYNHGYNQTIGGKDSVTTKIEDEVIDEVINLLQNTNLTYKEIQEKTNVSIPHISGINAGKKRPRENIIYPIRNSMSEHGKNNIKLANSYKRIPDEIILKVQEEILKNEKSFNEIGNLFNLSSSVIGKINNGKYKIDGYNYPLRKEPIKNKKRRVWTKEKIQNICNYIKENPSLTYAEIANNKQISLGMVRKIGQGGEGYRLENETYPLRGSGGNRKK